jgi:transposase
MTRSTINPDPSGVEIEGIHPDRDGLTIILRTSRKAVPCLDCDQLSECVHGWYPRTLADLPWQGVAVQFLLKTLRWFRRSSVCSRSIFTERLPEVVHVSARRTNRLSDVVEAAAFALGDDARARLIFTLVLQL